MKLQFLDLAAGIKKTVEEVDDFDYVYRLPTANLDYVKAKPTIIVTPPEKPPLNLMQQMFKNSHHSISEVRELLNKSHDSLRPVPRIGNLESIRSSISSRKNRSNMSMVRSLKQSFMSHELEQVLVNDIVKDENGDLVLVQTEVSRFKALPDIVYAYVDGNVVAAIGLGIMVILVCQVLVSVAQAQ